MINNFARNFRSRFADELRFLANAKAQPKTIGAVWPTGAVMARRMASIVDPQAALPVLELGPGTGCITKAILGRGLPPERLYAVEYAAEFVSELKRRFPDANILGGDAFNLDDTLGEFRDQKFDCAVSALPLLNFPLAMREHLLADVLGRLSAGRPMIQFSYGPFAPVPARPGFWTVERYDFVLRNIPPARLWLYRKPV